MIEAKTTQETGKTGGFV